ncbi:MAG: ABC transporter substrate-binding protein [Leucobacter sp.]|nr:ABC transporter substrate-binding protein [Leucobacter sp.]
MDKKHTKWAWGTAALATGLALALTGCASGDAPASEGSDGAPGSVVLGYPGGLGPGDAPSALALESLKEKGWEVEFIEFDSPDVQTQALLRGDVNFAAMGPSTVMSANLAGADLKMVTNDVRNDLQIVVSPDISECGDLDGKPVAYHSEGSTSTAHLKRWLADTCPDASPEFMVISGSANRATALIEGQIAGTVVRLEDWIPAIKGNETKAKVLTSLSEDQSNLLAHTITTTTDTIENKPELVEAYLEALQAEFTALQEDPAAYADRAAEVLGMDAAELVDVYEQLVELGIFPSAVGIDMDEVAATLKFYQESGSIPEGELAVSDIADDRYNS